MKPSDQPTKHLIEKANQLGSYVQQVIPEGDRAVFETMWQQIDEVFKRIKRYEGIADDTNK